jgi:hypothetical protein
MVASRAPRVSCMTGACSCKAVHQPASGLQLVVTISWRACLVCVVRSCTHTLGSSQATLCVALPAGCLHGCLELIPIISIAYLDQCVDAEHAACSLACRTAAARSPFVTTWHAYHSVDPTTTSCLCHASAQHNSYLTSILSVFFYPFALTTYLFICAAGGPGPDAQGWCHHGRHHP